MSFVWYNPQFLMRTLGGYTLRGDAGGTEAWVRH